VLVFISCNRRVNETAHIHIQNKTESAINVTLYPNAKFREVSFLGGPIRPTNFNVYPDFDGTYFWSNVILVSGDLNMKPYELVKTVFDSIRIVTQNEAHTIRFTHESATGYSENIFSKNSTWTFQIIHDNLHTMMASNPQKYHVHTFVISENNFVISDSTE